MNYYHYTPEFRIPDFLASQVINLAFASVNSSNEKAVAWVSSNQDWENTATKNVKDSTGKLKKLTFDEQVQMFGCARIQIKPTASIQNWNEITNQAKIKPNVVRQLEALGKKMGGKPSEWHGSLKPIPMNDWVNIEIYKDGNWIEIMNIENDTVSDVESRFFKLQVQ